MSLPTEIAIGHIAVCEPGAPKWTYPRIVIPTAITGASTLVFFIPQLSSSPPLEFIFYVKIEFITPPVYTFHDFLHKGILTTTS